MILLTEFRIRINREMFMVILHLREGLFSEFRNVQRISDIGSHQLLGKPTQGGMPSNREIEPQMSDQRSNKYLLYIELYRIFRQ